MTAHRIPLRGFWDATPLADGRTRYVRRFGRPRSTDDRETIWLVCDDLSGPATVSLNGTVIGEGDAIAADVTGRLAERNEVAVEVGGGAPDGMAVEIRTEPEPRSEQSTRPPATGS